MEQSGKHLHLFDPCDRYERDPDLLPSRAEAPASCVDCYWQYLPGRVCAQFQERLLKQVDKEAKQG